MNKALIITSVASMVDQFLLPSMFLLQDIGYDVHVACNFEKGNTCSAERVEELKKTLNDHRISFYQIDFERNVLQLSRNMYAYKQILNILSKNEFSLIHCHSPIGGLLGRFAARKYRKNGTKVFYTAHGFHFYKGAPLKNWVMYYPFEKYCSRFTDVLITINHEDYELAKRKMKAKKAEYVPGVGIDVKKIKNTVVDRAAMRCEIGVPEDAFLLTSVGELNENKNHQAIIRAMAKLQNKNIHYAIAGIGPLKQYLEELSAELGVSDQVHLLGYRNDVTKIYKSSDVCCFPSIREGLGLAAIEGMAAGLPIIVADNRGTREFARDGENGFVCKYNDIDAMANSIEMLLEDSDLREKMKNINENKVKELDINNIISYMEKIYGQE